MATMPYGRLHSIWRTREYIFEMANSEHWGVFVRRILEAAH